MLTHCHHLGLAVRDLEKSLALHEQLFSARLISGPFTDPIQKVRVCFLELVGSALQLELIAPAATDSPINGYLNRGIGAYHLCYEVDDLQQTLAQLQAQQCRVLSPPQPAVAFEGRSIAWLLTPTQLLLELVESPPR